MGNALFAIAQQLKLPSLLETRACSPHYVEAIARSQGPIGLPFEFFVRKILSHDWGQQEVVIDALAG